MSRIRRVLIAAFALSLVAASLAQPLAAARAPVVGPAPIARPATQLADQLTVAIAANPQSMHPHKILQIEGWSIAHSMFNYLLERDFAGTLTPALAESYQILDDRTIRFNLRRGVFFHNGEEFNADSVIFSVETIKNPEVQAPGAGNYAVVDRVEKVDDYTALFHLKQPSPGIFDALSRELAMLPPVYGAQVGLNGFVQRPIGTGPYKFVEFVSDDRTVLEANDQYWGGLPKGWAVARRLVFKPMPEPATRLANLQAGTVNLARALSSDAVRPIEAAGGPLRVLRVPVPRITFVSFNTYTGQFTDQRARQALNYAVDRESLNLAFQDGLGEILATHSTSVTANRYPGLTPYPYDPRRARELLQEAGFTLPIDATLGYASLENRELIEAIAGNLRESGVNVTLQGAELAVFNPAVREKATTDLRFSSYGPHFDPLRFYQFFVRSQGGLSVFNNPAMDNLIAPANSTMDPTLVAQYSQQVDLAIYDDPSAIYLFTLVAVYGLDSTVPDFKPRPDDYILLTAGRP